MKLLIWLLIALFIVWRWRSRTPVKEVPQPPNKTPVATDTVDMRACEFCGLHMPVGDMVAGAQGAYCSALHRDLAES